MDGQDIVDLHQNPTGASMTARGRSLLIVLLVYWLVVAFLAVTVWGQRGAVNFNLV